MKYNWRITKYNPEFRDSNGNYQKDEWTSFSDIGKIFAYEELTIEEYLKYESLYINAIVKLMDGSGVKDLRIVDLEVYEDDKQVDNRMVINAEGLKVIVPEILRERLWCKLENNNFFVHFGYDYNMYIGSNVACTNELSLIEESGLFVEEFTSPYI